MATNLVFENLPLSNPADLVFGEVDVAGGDYAVTLDATFALSFAAQIEPVTEATLSVTFPLSLSAEVEYDIAVSRPLVGQATDNFSLGVDVRSGVRENYTRTLALQATTEMLHSEAVPRPTGAQFGFQQAERLDNAPVVTRHQNATRVGTWSSRDGYSRLTREHRHVGVRGQDGVRLGTHATQAWQERYRDRRARVAQRNQRPQQLRYSHSERSGAGVARLLGWRSRFQDAMVPQPGVSPSGPVVPPGPTPCYLPDSDLLLYDPYVVSPHLLFVCDNDSLDPGASVVVPIRRVYVVINNISLRRVSDNTQLPALAMTLSIDVDSWTWGFSATLPESALDAVMPDSGGAIELEANINGTLYRVLAENISRERAFAQRTVSVGGRGKSALLASPYSPVLTFSNDQLRSAQQLMNDVLTINGVPLGWTVDWGLTDWFVPAGVFNVRGSYIDGVNAIAAAAGAYVQPHPNQQTLRVRHRYPSAPWEWGTVTPDFDIPADVAVREAIEWIEKPAYNRVYVSGQSQGILGRVTRSGTAGDLVAPMVTDALITETPAARQRGIAILGDTGRQANVTLRMPVLPETGVIEPGKFVRYNEGSTQRLGIVRSTSVEASWPEVWQSLVVETHV